MLEHSCYNSAFSGLKGSICHKQSRYAGQLGKGETILRHAIHIFTSRFRPSTSLSKFPLQLSTLTYLPHFSCPGLTSTPFELAKLPFNVFKKESSIRPMCVETHAAFLRLQRLLRRSQNSLETSPVALDTQTNVIFAKGLQFLGVLLHTPLAQTRLLILYNITVFRDSLAKCFKTNIRYCIDGHARTDHNWDGTPTSKRQNVKTLIFPEAFTQSRLKLLCSINIETYFCGIAP